SGVAWARAPGVGETAADSRESGAQARRNMARSPPQRRTAAQAMAARAFDLGSKPALEIKRLVAVEENPRSRLDRVGEARAASREPLDRFDRQRRRRRDACAWRLRLDHGEFRPPNAGPRARPLRAWRLRQAI